MTLGRLTQVKKGSNGIFGYFMPNSFLNDELVVLSTMNSVLLQALKSAIKINAETGTGERASA